MSEENVEIVRRVYDGYLSGDFERALSLVDPAVECDVSIRPDGKVYRGHDGVIEALRTWSGTWEAFRIDVEEIIDGGDSVVGVERQSGRGKGSGLPMAQQTFSVFTIDDGKVTRILWLQDRGEALEAAGLSE
jgi:uncharacterized protein